MTILLCAVIFLTLLVSLAALIQKKCGKNPSEVLSNHDLECCGAHEVCEAGSLLSKDATIIYYDDEELDRFRDRSHLAYSDAEIEEFREVLLSMNEAEVPAWLRSLRLREVALPPIVKDEALMIVDEIREFGKMQ